MSSRAIVRTLIDRGFLSLPWIARQTGKRLPHDVTDPDVLSIWLDDIDWSVVSPHPFFEPQVYLKNNRDVHDAGYKPLDHFFEHGYDEERESSRFFSRQIFLSQFPAGDYEAIFDYAGGRGRDRVRWLNPWFDAQYYRNRYSLEPGTDEIGHFVDQGMYEGNHPCQLFESLVSASATAARKAPRDTRRGVDIVIPFYQNAFLAALMLQSLRWMEPELAACNARLILINDSPEDSDLARILASITAQIRRVEVMLFENEANLGFVKSTNRGLKIALEDQRHAVLLNSDAFLTPGSLVELLDAVSLDPLSRFATPRSNNATIATMPSGRFYDGKPLERYWHDYNTIREDLPPTSFVPVGVGFCLYIDYKILEEFGLLDEAYGAGYYEENDLILRANRFGYRAVLANRAYAFHIGSVSFGGSARTEQQKKNGKLFDHRYPEFPKMLDTYLGSSRRGFDRLIQGRIKSDGKRRLLIDLSSLSEAFNGTFEVARSLLIAADHAWSASFDVDVWASKGAWDAHGLSALPFKRVDPPVTLDERERPYAIGFRLGQPFTVGELNRLATTCCQIGFLMLDAIALDCGYLADPNLEKLWQFVWQTADFLVYPSAFSRDQFERRFGAFRGIEKVIYLSLSLQDYVYGGEIREPESPLSEDFVLIIGNHYEHKDVKRTLQLLATEMPDVPIYALWDKTLDLGGRKIFQSGQVSEDVIRWLYRRCRCVVMPSHYEGFGFPILRTLAQGRPIFVRRTPLNEDLYSKLHEPSRLHFYDSINELAATLRETNFGHPSNTGTASNLETTPVEEPTGEHNWKFVAKEIGKTLAEVVQQFDSATLEQRILIWDNTSFHEQAREQQRRVEAASAAEAAERERISAGKHGRLIRDLQERTAELSAKLAASTQETADLSAALYARSRELNSVLGSRSWRITRPMRFLISRVPGVRKSDDLR